MLEAKQKSKIKQKKNDKKRKTKRMKWSEGVKKNCKFTSIERKLIIIKNRKIRTKTKKY